MVPVTHSVTQIVCQTMIGQFGSFAAFVLALVVLVCCCWLCKKLCLGSQEQHEGRIPTQGRNYGTNQSLSSISEDLAPRYSQLEENIHDGDPHTTRQPTYNTGTQQTTSQHQDDDGDERPPSYNTVCVPH